VAAKFVNHKLILRFHVVNRSDVPDSAWFFPGFYYSAIRLYRLSDNQPRQIPDTEPDFPDSIGYRLLDLAPHDSAVFLAELKFVKTYTNNIRPRLIQKSHLTTFIFELSSVHLYVNIVTYIFCGLLLMMILFSAANYVLGGNQEFLYYTGYALFLGGMLFTKTYWDHNVNSSVFFMEAYLDFVMQCTGIGFYMLFMQGFLSARTTYPFLYKLYDVGLAGLVIAVLLFSYSYFLTNNFIFLNTVENATKIILLGMMVIFLLYCARKWNDKLLRYLF
jgi:hypothetical protein